MRHSAELTKLRGNPAPQYRAQAVMAERLSAWRSEPQVAALIAELDGFGSGASYASCGRLQRCFADFELASHVTGSLVASFAQGLASQPLGLVPFRHQITDDGASLVLANAGDAQLLLTQRDPTNAVASTVTFCDVERRDIVLTGHAEGRVIERETPDHPPRQNYAAMRPGFVFECEAGDGALLVDRILAPLVTLRLVRHKPRAAETVQVSLETGQVLARAAGSISDSRRQLAISLLGAMQREDAVPTLAQLAQNGDAATRWQALRQCLSMDTAAGFFALGRISANPRDSLSAEALRLKDGLIAAHPVLATFLDKEAA